MTNLKLFVVGESSGDPAKWNEENRSLVMAFDADEAKRLAEHEGEAFEVICKSPQVLEYSDHFDRRLRAYDMEW